MMQYYRYSWGNNEKRRTMKGRVCLLITCGKRHSCLIEFIDNGQKEIVSRRSVRKIIPPKY